MSEWPLDIQILSSKQVHCMKANAVTLLSSMFTSPARTRLRHWSLGSKQRQWRRRRRAQWKTKITLREILHQTLIQKQNGKKIWCWKGGTGIPSFGFKKSDTNQTLVICKTCHQQVVTSDSNTSNLFSHLKTWHEKQYGDSEKMWQSTNVTSKPQWQKEKNTPNEPESLE